MDNFEHDTASRRIIQEYSVCLDKLTGNGTYWCVINRAGLCSDKLLVLGMDIMKNMRIHLLLLYGGTG